MIEPSLNPLVNEKFYACGAWWGPTGVFSAPIRSLLAHGTPTRLCTVVSPRSLALREQMEICNLSMRLQTLACTRHQYSPGATGEHKNTQAASAAHVIGEKLKRLNRAFWVQTFVMSPCPNTARTVASILAADIESQHPSVTAGGGLSLPLESQAMVVPVTTKRDLDKVNEILRGSPPDPGISPLPERPSPRCVTMLMDARGAATCFRLPISVKAGFPGIEVCQLPPDFSPGPRVLDPPPDQPSIPLGRLFDGRQVRLPLSVLTRHVLITGFTGSGKTETTLTLLHHAWNAHHVPFLVLEPAKKEYRGLSEVRCWYQPKGQDPTKVVVFTAGDETAAPLRFNPLQPLAGVRIETHLGRVLTCLEAALPQFGVLPSILQQALEESYGDCGWKDLSTVASDDPQRQFPTMEDLFERAELVIARRGYGTNMTADLSGAIRSRFYPLTAGSLGKMLNTDRSVDPSRLYTRPTVIEMNDLRTQDKILLTLFLLVHVREYREVQGQASSLRHLTVIEEAHNVFPRTEDRSGLDVSNALFQAVQTLANMLAEMRSYGEGIIIADQSPQKLAPDAMRNTGTQIVHQLRDADDRLAVARTMVMSEEQAEFLAKLPPGHAALFTVGLQRTTFLEVPRYRPPRPDEATRANVGLDADPAVTGEGYAHDHRIAPTSEPLRHDMLSRLQEDLDQARQKATLLRIERGVLLDVGLGEAVKLFEQQIALLLSLPQDEAYDPQAGKVMSELVAKATECVRSHFPEASLDGEQSSKMAAALFDSLWMATDSGRRAPIRPELLLKWFPGAATP